MPGQVTHKGVSQVASWREYDIVLCWTTACLTTFMADPSLQHQWAEMRRVQPDGAVLFCGTHLSVRVAVLKPGVVLASARGEVLDPADQNVEMAMLAEFDRELDRAGTFALFADLRESEGLSPASRKKIASWMRRHQARLLPSHVLVGSKLTEIALSIITMLVGGGLFQTHTNPQTFLALLNKVSPKLTKLPQVPDP